MRKPVPILLGALAALAIVAAVALLLLHHSISSSPPPDATASGSGPFLTASAMPQGLAGKVVPRFKLSDARGGTISNASVEGRPYALTFLYVHCVDVCPLIGSELHDSLADLGTQARALNVVAISVDPKGDTRGAVRRWLANHHEPANFHYLIGSERRLAPIWKAFYVSPQTPGDPQSTHTAIIWLIDRQGRLAALIPAGLPIKVPDLTHDLRVLVQQA